MFDEKLAQYAYLVGCQETGEALVIDPERDIDRYIEAAAAEGLTITAVTETHIHADFLSGARELAERLDDVTLYLSDEGDADWKYGWTEGYNVTFLHDGDTFSIGNIEVEAVHSPGHTPEHLSYLITDRGGAADRPMGIATGDFVFVGDLGRPDLLETAAGHAGVMKPSAKRLYKSTQRFLAMDDYLQVWPGHGAGSACGKALGAVPETTVGYERRFSPAIDAAQQGEDDFVSFILADQPEPPVYFARMKQQNRDGVPLLGTLPTPDVLDGADVEALALDADDTVVLDARADREAFMAGHLPGSLYAAWSKSFPTIAGSYVTPDEDIYLVIDPADAEEAVRNLVRIGLDRVQGIIAPETLAAYAEAGGALASIDRITIDALDEARAADEAHVVDVRSLAEYRDGHVPNAQLAPHTRLTTLLDELPRDEHLVVHCGSGARAAAASSLLTREGFDLTYVDGTFDEWLEAHPDEQVAERATA